MKNVVFSNGVFDLLHVGHFRLFQYCERLAGAEGKIYLALDSDEKVKRDKGATRPIFTFEERKRAIHNNIECIEPIEFQLHHDLPFRLARSIDSWISCNSCSVMSSADSRR